MAYQIKEVADLAGISVRTLHYYDQIGLLTPSAASPAGYRIYSDADLERLQQVLFYRELGFPLQEIKRIVGHPGFDREKALEGQRELLLQKRARFDAMIETVDQTLRTMRGDGTMSKREMFKGMAREAWDRHRSEYAEEARALYGSETVDRSDRRFEALTDDERAQAMENWEAIYKALARHIGGDPTDPEVQELVAAKRAHISRYFYDCTLEIFRGLGELYVSDSRFTKNIDRYGEGLAAFLQQAIGAYCDSQSGR
ncbi:MAG: MerR family transcriptional regulator [Solirubrobacterales bacterium]